VAVREILSTAVSADVVAELRQRAAEEDRSVSNLAAHLLRVAIERGGGAADRVEEGRREHQEGGRK